MAAGYTVVNKYQGKLFACQQVTARKRRNLRVSTVARQHATGEPLIVLFALLAYLACLLH